MAKQNLKVLLINPPGEHTITADNPAFIDEERGFTPPLGLLYVAAYAEKHSPHKIEILDMPVEGIRYEDLGRIIEEKRPDIVGMTALTFTIVDVLRAAEIVKKTSKDIQVVLGGVHPYIYPHETLELGVVDFLILGEGERAFVEFLNNRFNPERWQSIEGLAFRSDGKVVTNYPAKFIEDLDELPFPARHLTPYTKYSSVIAKRHPITTMITSRGCPYACSFCARPHLGRGFRYREAKRVVDEMEACVRMGIKEFLLYDDTFTVNHKRVFEVCDEIIRRKLDIGWDIRARVDCMDEEMLEKLKAARCERIHYGVEAGTERVIKVLAKNISLDQVKRIFKLTKKYGIATLAYFMIGSPTETKEEIEETIRFARALNPDYTHITFTTPFPATEMYDDYLRSGKIKVDYWREFARRPQAGFAAPYCPDTVSRDELMRLSHKAYRSFYFRPSYIIKNVVKVRSLSEFTNKAKMATKILVGK
ncbi:MAG: radical SAM protein [Candidatus Omnitrophica bacterium]|nr:radical SAM protein [Candidatus Omnitrophota bacterium]